jgi:hypothetical protein
LDINITGSITLLAVVAKKDICAPVNEHVPNDSGSSIIHNQTHMVRVPK